MEYPKSIQPLPEHAKKVFEGVLFTVWQWEQKMFDGSVQTFEKVSRNTSVGILPLTKEGEIIVTIQEQPGIQTFLSLVGGIVDPGEDIVLAAHRELLEEVGAKTPDLELWYSVQPITKVEWPIYIFVARNCEIVSEKKLDAGEKITHKLINWEEFLEIIYLNEFRDTEVALKIMKMQKNPDELEQFKTFLFGQSVN